MNSDPATLPKKSGMRLEFLFFLPVVNKMNDVIAQLQQQVHANASGGFEQVNWPF
jgi:hypothetical protein